MGRSAVLPVLNSALCVLVILICLSIFLTQGLGVYAARARGKSMLPTIPSDAFVVLSHKHPEIGDIVHVRGESYNYIHRLVEVNGDIIKTRGDNCEISEVAMLDDVSGVVIFHAPFKSFLILALMVIVIEGMLAVFWSGRIMSEVTRRRFSFLGS